MKTKTLTDKAVLATLANFCIDNGGNTYTGNAFAIVTETDGELKFHPRTNQPCWGELRTYQVKLDGVHKPGDLHSPFPDGTPVGLAIPLRSGNPFLRFALTNPMSPWRDLVGKGKLIESKGALVGVVFDDTTFNSDILGNFLFFMRMGYPRILNEATKYSDLELLAEFLLVTNASPEAGGYGGDQDIKGMYFTNGPAKFMNGENYNFKRVATGTPGVPENWSFRDRSPYRRPLIEVMWRDTVPAMPKDVPAFSGPEKKYGAPNPKTNTSIAALCGAKAGDNVSAAELVAFIPKIVTEITACL